jgi:cystathionine beta-lyase/cystathionine gamma-synthase
VLLTSPVLYHHRTFNLRRASITTNAMTIAKSLFQPL